VGGEGEPEGVLDAARAGESWALAELYRRHQPALLRFLIGLAGGEAEDLAADTWVAAARALSGFEGDDGRFRAMLFTIARRRAIDLVRSRSRRRTAPADPAALVDEPAAGTADPAHALDAAVASRAALELVAELLPPRQAEVVLLRVVAGLSVAEVAEVTGERPATVSVLQSRGLRRLAQRLGSPAALLGEPADRAPEHPEDRRGDVQDPGPLGR
jgi:RNA polymerase sigma-70 factor (ECF subfamily)